MRRFLAAIAVLAAPAMTAQAYCERSKEEARVDALEFAAQSCRVHLKVYRDDRSSDCMAVQGFSADMIALCGRQALTLATIATVNNKLQDKHIEDATYWTALMTSVNDTREAVEAAADVLGVSFELRPAISQSTVDAIAESASEAAEAVAQAAAATAQE